jgi:signal transduction histidine kinase
LGHSWLFGVVIVWVAQRQALLAGLRKSHRSLLLAVLGLLFLAAIGAFSAALRLLVVDGLKAEARYLLASSAEQVEWRTQHHPSFQVYLRRSGQIWRSEDWLRSPSERLLRHGPSAEGMALRAGWVDGQPKILLLAWRGDWTLLLCRRADSALISFLLLGICLFLAGCILLLFRRASAQMLLPVDRELLTAAELDAAKERFFASIFHELGTPLTSLMSRLETMLEREGDQGRRLALSRCYQDALSLSSLAADQLQRARFEAGNATLQWEEIPVDGLFSGLSLRLDILLELAGMAMVAEVPSGPSLWADRLKIEQALTNLITNAIKYGRKDQTIRLLAWREEQKLILVVEDGGEGFDAEPYLRQGLVFHGGGRALAGRESTGLGLWLVQRIAQAHGGELAFCREGLRFRALLILPQEQPRSFAPNRLDAKGG